MIWNDESWEKQAACGCAFHLRKSSGRAPKLAVCGTRWRTLSSGSTKPGFPALLSGGLLNTETGIRRTGAT